jgi:hypothetical protein
MLKLNVYVSNYLNVTGALLLLTATVAIPGLTFAIVVFADGTVPR